MLGHVERSRVQKNDFLEICLSSNRYDIILIKNAEKIRNKPNEVKDDMWSNCVDNGGTRTLLSNVYWKKYQLVSGKH